MEYQLLQLNVQHGRFLEAVLKFLKKGKFDIINFQEVAGGKTHLGNNGDTFEKIKKATRYRGAISVSTRFRGVRGSYFGNATFVKKNLAVKRYSEIWLKKFKETNLASFVIQDLPRSVLSSTITLKNQDVEVINAHLAWGPNPKDREYKMHQAKKLYNYIQKLRHPFILTGDFNMTPDTKVVKMFGRLARNLTIQYKIANTLNLRTHRAQHLFPKGYAVDFVFVSKEIKVKKFVLVDQPDLSDHFGLALKFSL